MPVFAKRVVATKDAMCAAYVERWAKWFSVDGKGLLVPAVRKADLPRLETKTAELALATKEFNPKDKLWFGGIANAKEVDRMNEVVQPTGIIAGPYLKNSVLLFAHDHRLPVGLVSMLRPEDNGVHFEAWAGDPSLGTLTRTQEDTRSLMLQRILKAVSIGFIPLKIRMPAYNDQGEMVDPASIEEWEMLELSIVAVPANAGALFDLKEGSGETRSRATDARPRLSLPPSLAFPTLGADGRFQLPKPEKKKMDEKELKELLSKLTDTLSAIAKGIDGIKSGQDDLKKSLEKGKKPDPADDEDEDDPKKGLKARLDTVEKGLKDCQEAIQTTHKTLEMVVERLK